MMKFSAGLKFLHVVLADKKKKKVVECPYFNTNIISKDGKKINVLHFSQNSLFLLKEEFYVAQY